MNQSDGLWLTPREYEKRIKELEEKNIELRSIIESSGKAMSRFMNSPYTGTDDDILTEIDDALRQCSSALYTDRYHK